ncbi:MAG: hypothetical protein H9W82_12320 [Lactobacillus sp.]|nr:hypothetical protein [Lactobacillus sp.]
MAKVIRENLRLDVLTAELLNVLVEKLPDGSKKNKSELFRSAIYRIAKEDLTPDEFYEAVQRALDIENV